MDPKIKIKNRTGFVLKSNPMKVVGAYSSHKCFIFVFSNVTTNEHILIFTHIKIMYTAIRESKCVVDRYQEEIAMTNVHP